MSFAWSELEGGITCKRKVSKVNLEFLSQALESAF